MKKALKFIWSLLRGHLMLKIMAIVFAVILWSYVLAEINPARTRVIEDVRIKYENTAELKAKDLYISEMIETVDIRVEVKQNELQYLNDEKVRAVVDLSAINGPGEQTLRVTAQTDYGRVLEVNPATITLNVDDYVSQSIPVNVEVSGNVPQGYYAGQPVILPNVVSISGARADVERVSSAVCYIDLTGLTESLNKSVEIELLDDQNNVVDKTLFTDTIPSVIVQLDVLRKKTVPVNLESAIFGQENIAAGFEIVDITSTPHEVDIAGEFEVLAGITSINLVPYVIENGENTSVATLLEYQVPEGVQIVAPERAAQVFINIREITETRTFSRIELRAKNIESGLNARLGTRVIDVNVLAGLSKLSALSRADIVPYVDLDGLGAGTYTLDVRFELPDGFTVKNFSPSVATVTVTIF